MWKYVTRRLRDTLERSANHFDKRSSTGVVKLPSGLSDDNNRKINSPCCWFTTRKCWKSYQNDNGTKRKRNFEHINSSWLGAITWSSALVFGWYAGQIVHLKIKNQRKQKKFVPTTINSLLAHLSYAQYNQNVKKLDTIYEIENKDTAAPVVHLISNENSGEQENASKSSESSSNDLGEVLNSIENRLGLAAIESGQHKDGLNLLRSAANRNHPPALYNLGLCYEMGLGVDIDEKIAMELYRSAAALQHPGALYNLGIYYGQGRGGLAKDVSTATRLLRLAAVQGQRDAITALAKLDIDMKEPTSPHEEDHWEKKYNPLIENGCNVPTHSALFVGSVKPISSYNYEPIVY
ncbi:unnamed protein product [Leptosia nina]|uniref:Uncharacterized protein n=1 Tax=Leptosia nina TaxID=320188 RepID=A0AAV1J8G0_9NEOP